MVKFQYAGTVKNLNKKCEDRETHSRRKRRHTSQVIAMVRELVELSRKFWSGVTKIFMENWSSPENFGPAMDQFSMEFWSGGTIFFRENWSGGPFFSGKIGPGGTIFFRENWSGGDHFFHGKLVRGGPFFSGNIGPRGHFFFISFRKNCLGD